MTTSSSNCKTATKSSLNNLEEVYDRVTSEIVEALNADRSVLLEALPGTGKSRNLPRAVAKTGEPIALFTERGRKGRYNEIEQWCSNYGLSSKILPSVVQSCPIWRNDGVQGAPRAERLWNAGASPLHIHKRLPLPCQNSGSCPYESAINFDPRSYDVLIGHANHAHVDKCIENRTAVFDEFPEDAYLEMVANTPEVVSNFLDSSNLPFGNYGELLADRSSFKQRRKALRRLDPAQLVDEQRLFPPSADADHRLAGLCVLTLLTGTDLGNGWEQAILGKGRVGLHNITESTIYVLNPPDLPDSVLALDGTPTKELWELALGRYYQRHEGMDHRRLLTDGERWDYLLHLQGLQIALTTSWVRPYSGTNRDPARDAALLHEIGKQETGKKGVISSKDGIEDLKKEFHGMSSWRNAYYGNLLGSNKLKNVDVGAVIGSPHFGDEYVEKWSALAGIAAEANGRKGLDRSYGEFGDKILRHMREHSVLQALFRFARERNGATVYVDTICLPDWVPVVADHCDTNITIRRASSDKEKIVEVLKQSSPAKTREIADEVGCSAQYVGRVLGDLAADDYVLKRDAPDGGRGNPKEWVDIHLQELNPYGHVELPRPGAASRFSKQTRYRTTKGTVSKNRFPQTSRQREWEERAGFERRQQGWFQQCEMEWWYESG